MIAPATARNRDPIVDVLATVLPETGTVLEVASGSGEHIVHFARRFPHLDWLPSDPSAEARDSIAAWSASAKHPNIADPLALDAASDDWPVARADAVLCINMIHISPWAATLGLLDGAARILPMRGPLYLYGPYRQHDVPLAPSNAMFDESLRQRNPGWGLRQLEDVVTQAEARGLALDRIVAMPANNLSVILRRR